MLKNCKKEICACQVCDKILSKTFKTYCSLKSNNIVRILSCKTSR